MSRYLQRLASQAVKPQATVRPLINPFTGPVTTGARLGSTEEALLEEADHSLADESERVVVEAQTPAPLADASPVQTVHSSVGAENARLGVGRNGHAVATDQFEPLLNETAVEVSATRLDDEPRIEFSPGELPEDAANRLSVGRRPARVVGDPLTSGRGARRELSSAEPQTPHPQPQKDQARQHRGAPPQGANEIQINIGRIEVTAMPQAMPRTEPPARKAPKLGEYLRRRNGRDT
jgi:hypothetical protein